MPLYEFFCDRCGLSQERYFEMNAKHFWVCPRCGSEARKVFSNITFKIKGWSPDNERKVDDHMAQVNKALTDESPVTRTMQDVAAEQLEKRAERRGEDKSALIKDVLGGGRKKKELTDKNALAKRAKKQRALIDRKYRG